jgi:hypothetical protein
VQFIVDGQLAIGGGVGHGFDAFLRTLDERRKKGLGVLRQGQASIVIIALLLPPPEIQYPLTVSLPDYLQHYRDTVAGHPAAQWIAQIYRRHRGRSAELPRERPATR